MWIFFVLRWVLIVAIMAVALATFYRYGPDRKNAKWQWVSWGAAAAIIIWLIGTLLFFFYAQNFGSFGENYGVVAGLIILMTWFNLSAFIFLLGAQVNHGLERQTAKTTQE
jgi:membrane protein